MTNLGRFQRVLTPEDTPVLVVAEAPLFRRRLSGRHCAPSLCKGPV